MPLRSIGKIFPLGHGRPNPGERNPVKHKVGLLTYRQQPLNAFSSVFDRQWHFIKEGATVCALPKTKKRWGYAPTTYSGRTVPDFHRYSLLTYPTRS